MIDIITPPKKKGSFIYLPFPTRALLCISTFLGSVGIVCPSVECKIVDDQGNGK